MIKDMIIRLIVGLIKKILNEIPSYKNERNFPKPFKSFGGNINVEADLCNYATKTDLKNIAHVDTSSFAQKSKFS